MFLRGFEKVGFASSLHRAVESEEFELAKALAAFFSGIMLSALFVAFVLAVFSSSAGAYSSCSSSSSCDFAGQSCRQYFSNGCSNSLSCQCTAFSQTFYWLEPFYKDCFCLSQLDLNAVYDGTATGDDSSVGFEVFVSQGTRTFFEQKSKTVYDTKCYFNGGGDVSCPHRDPPVECKLFLSGPGVANTLVGSKVINVDPNRLYLESFNVPSTLLSRSGTYFATVDCGIQLPANSIECVSSCSAAHSTISFGISKCNPSVSVSAGKYSYSSGEAIEVSGVLRNEGTLADGQVIVELRDSSGVVSSQQVFASGGHYSASFQTNALSGGSYSVVARASVNSCSEVSASTSIEFTKCAVSISANVPSSSSSGAPVVANGQVFNDNAPVQAKVVISTRNSGQTVELQEVFTNAQGGFSASLGPFSNGDYSSEFSAYYEDCPAAKVSSSFNVACTLASSIQASTSNYLVGETVLVSGNVSSPNANYVVLVKDSSGNVVVQKTGSATAGAFSESFSNLSQGNYVATVQASQGQCASSASTVSFAVGCDISAKVVQLPQCYGNEEEFYVVRVDNLLPTQNVLQLTYSSPLQLSGPASSTLSGLESRLFNFTVNAAEDVTGNTVGLVNVFGEGALCPQKLQLPICVRGKIAIEANPEKVQAIAGTTQCIPVTLRNRGPDSAIVALSAVSISGSNFSPYFNTNKVKLSAYEIRDDLRLCADVPSGTAGLHSFTIRGQSAINDAQGDATFEVLDSQNKISTSFSGCTLIDANSQVPLTVTNNLMAGDYWIEFTDNDGLGIFASPSAILNFGTGSPRTLYLSFSPIQLNSSRNRYADFVLKKDGREVLRQSLCFYTQGNASTVGSGTTASSLSPQTITSACNSQGVSLLKVKNNAGATAAYSFSAATSAFTVSFSPQTLSLSPNSEGTVSVQVAPKGGTTAGSYSIPITVQYSANQSNDQARIECGNGNTISTNTCTGTSGVCSANCYYSGNAGNFAVSASLRGISCAQTQVAVGGVSSCVLSASPNSLSTGSSSTISVDYNNLGYTPSAVSINCGNGNTVTASGCTGTSGSCSATCQYPNSGVYSVSASASGQSCASTQIAAGATSAWCALVPSSKFVGGSGSTTISVYYQNMPSNYPSSTTTNSYSNTEILYANVPSNCPVQNFGSSLTYVGGTPVPGAGAQQNASLQNASNASVTLPVNISIASSNHSYSIESGVLEAFAEFVVANPANATASIFATARVAGLPSDWNVSITPANASIQPGGNATFSVRVSAQNFEARDYNASFEVVDSQNRTASMPFKIKAGDAASLGGIISGFFVLGAGDANILMLVIVALLMTGGFLVYKASRNVEKAREIENQ